MNSFLAPNNRTSLTGIIDFTAHNIYLIQEDGTVKNILDILFAYGNIAVAELVDVQLNEFTVTQMYQFIGEINDNRVPGLESILNYIDENFFNKTDPAVNNYHYYISKTFNTQNNEEHYYNKQQYITNNVNNHIIKKDFIYNNEQVLNIRKEYSPKIYNSTSYRTVLDYVENNLYKRYDNRIFNNTSNVYKNINQHNTEFVNTYKINKHLNLKKTYYNINDNIVIHKNNTINTNDNRNVTKHNKLFNITDNSYHTKKINNTSNITNNITKHNHNNYEHNVIKKVTNHLHNKNNYHNHNNYEHNVIKKVTKHLHNKKNYYNFYNDTFNVRKVENISLSQQTDIVNIITETNEQTISYIDDNFLNNNNISTVEINIGSDLITDNYTWTPSPSDTVVPGLESLLLFLENQYITLITLNGAITASYNQTMLEVEDLYLNKFYIARLITIDNNLQWFPLISDLYVPGLESLLEFLQLNYATIASLQNAITDMHNHIQTEIDNIDFPTNPDAGKTTRHHYINHEHTIFKKVNNHIHNKKNYYNFYNDTFNFKKNDNNVESQSISKELHYNTTHTDYMYQRKIIKNHKTFITQQNYFTYQRKANNELQIQALNAIVADLQNQINVLSGG